MKDVPQGGWRQLVLNLFVSGCAIVFCIIVAEIFFRSIKYDFSSVRKLLDATPIYYRVPDVPVGDIFFRREGPAVWRGQVLNPGLKSYGGKDRTYEHESPVTITYDKDGLRNPDALTDWEIVVAGDSFVELGYLPYEDLFSTQLGKLLGKSVKNLGVSYSAPLTYNYFLNAYGKSRSTRDAVMVFFEGNDISELITEHDNLVKFQQTGKREYRTITRQTSFIRAIAQALLGLKNYKSWGGKYFQNAYFVTPQGEIPISVDCMPKNGRDIEPGKVAVLKDALSLWAESARNLGMKPWLVYMPCKMRVFNGLLRFPEGSPSSFLQWRPSDLPDLLRDLATERGIGFIDVTPDLVDLAQRGILPYNPVFDTHLNRQGAAAVAQRIAGHLSPGSQEERSRPATSSP